MKKSPSSYIRARTIPTDSDTVVKKTSVNLDAQIVHKKGVNKLINLSPFPEAEHKSSIYEKVKADSEKTLMSDRPRGISKFAP